MLLKLKLSHPPLLSLFRLRSWKNDTERVVLYWRIVFYHDSTVTANQDSSEEGGGRRGRGLLGKNFDLSHDIIHNIIHYSAS